MHLQNLDRAKIRNIDVAKTNDPIHIKIKMPNPSEEPPAPTQAPNQASKSRQRAKTRNIGVAKTSDHIQIKIKLPNPSQEPPAPTKAPNQNIKDMDVLCTFNFKIESQYLYL